MTQVMHAWEKLPEKTRAEVIDNKLYMSPQPKMGHLRIQGKLYRDLWNYADVNGLGEVFQGGDIFLEDNSQVVVPDVFFISKKNKYDVEDRGVFGAPRLAIEILSPGNAKHDWVRKKNLYERNGVREYWIIDPETREATGYLLKKGTYGRPLVMTSKLLVRIFNLEISF